MKTSKEKSQIRRERAAEAIAALGIPGVTTTRNLEAWLIREKATGNNVSVVVSWGSLSATYPHPATPEPDTAREAPYPGAFTD